MKKVYFLIFAALFQLAGFSQIVNIGTGTVTSSSSPWDPYYGYSYAQTIYLASEINTTATITSVAFDFAGLTLDNSNQIVVYMGHTTKSAFSSTTDWESAAALTEVYNGTISGFTAPGLVTITLTTPFTYNGVDNLVIAVDENKDNYDGIDRFNATAIAGSNRTLSYISDITNPDPFAPPGGTLGNTVANVQLNFTTGTCFSPTGITFSNINTTSGMASWSSPSTGTTPAQYNWELRTSGAAGSGATGLVSSGNATTNDAIFTSLLPATNYIFYVRSDCGGASTSNWNQSSFITSCDAVNVPYLQDFESAIVPNFPLCTSAENAGTGNIWITSDAPESYFPNKTLNYQYDGVNDANTWFYTAGINLTGGTSYRLEFKYGNNSTFYTEKLEVKYGISPLSTDMTDLIVDYPAISINNSAQSVTEFTPSSSGVYYIGFHAYSVSNQDQLYVDDISLIVTPTCDVPTGVVHSNVTTSGAQLDWTAPAIGNPVNYHIYYSTSRTTPSSTATLNDSSVSTTYIMTGLTSATKYFVWIRSNCGGGNTGPWSAVDSFVTECIATNSFNETFDGAIIPALPTCWSTILRGATINAAYISTVAANAYSTPNAVVLSNVDAGTTDDIILVSPPLSNLAAGTYRVTFWAKNNSANEDIEVGTLDNNTSGAIFTPLQTVDVTGTYQKFVVDFSSYTGTDTHIGLRRLSTLLYSSVYIDNVIWELIPSCLEPTDVMADSAAATLTTATIMWTPPSSSSPTSYDIYYSTSNVPPTSSATPSVAGLTGTSVVLTGLNPSTNYFVWVRSNCGSGSLSAWSVVPAIASTACAASVNVPYIQNFESSNVPALPLCTSMENAGAGSNWIVSNNPGYTFTNNTLQYNWNFSNPANVWFYTPGLNLTGGVSYRLTFKYGNNASTVYSEKLEVKYGISTSSIDMSDLIVDYPSIQIGGSAMSVSDFTPSTTGVYYLGFHAYSDANQDFLFVDDISLVETSTVPVTLGTLTGKREGSVNLLAWKTLTEANNTGFEIQRSADGKNFSRISFTETKAANGNSSSQLTYSFIDSKPFTSACYYRLKQIDKDGKFKFSNVALIKGIRSNELMLSKIYPNPASSKLNVVLTAPANQKVSIVLTDLAGKLVMQQQAELVIGDNNLTLNIASLPSGSYLLKAACNNGCEIAVRKVVKQ